MNKLPPPAILYKFILEAFKLQFSPEVLQILKTHHVSPERYLAWAVYRYRKDGLIYGLLLAILWGIGFTFFSIHYCFSSASTDGSSCNPDVFKVFLGVDALFFIIFVVVAFSLYEGANFINEKDMDPSSRFPSGQFQFFITWLNALTSLRYLQKIKEPVWGKIRGMDLKVLQKTSFNYFWEPRKSVVFLLLKTKRFLKWAGVIAIPFFLASLYLLTYRGLHELPLWIEFLFKWIPAVFYLVMVIGLTSWPILVGVIGIYARDLTGFGNHKLFVGLQENRFTGIMGIFLGVLTIGWGALMAGICLWAFWAFV